MKEFIGSLVKVFFVLAIICFVIFSFSKCSDIKNKWQEDKEIKAVQTNIIGFWKNDTTGNCVKITKDTIKGLYNGYGIPEISTVKYELSSLDVMTIYNSKGELFTELTFVLPDDKHTLYINDGLSHELDTYERIPESEYKPALVH